MNAQLRSLTELVITLTSDNCDTQRTFNFVRQLPCLKHIDVRLYDHWEFEFLPFIDEIFTINHAVKCSFTHNTEDEKLYEIEASNDTDFSKKVMFYIVNLKNKT